MPSLRRSAVRATAMLLLVVVAGCSSKSGSSTAPPVVTTPGSLSLTTVATITGGGSHMPVLAISPAGDTHRLFVVDKAGVIRIVKDDVLLTRPFLDIQSLINATYLERGLLGLAFSPNYSTDKSFYVCYNSVANYITVARYKVSTDPESASVGSAQIIITQQHDAFPNHNGGMIAFGPDGYLYFSLGDGGSQDDPDGHGQDVTEWLASILRLDVSGGVAGYSVPADNPFTGGTPPGVKPELWCYGLRNPWRFSFDRSTGDLYIGDVGQDTYEEVDVATAASGRGKGLNFGWSVMEGDSCFSPASGCNRTGLTLPAIAYEHTGSQNCVIGGYVYRGSKIPGLVGTYLYSDNLGRWLHSFKYVGGVATAQKDWNVALAAGPPDGVNAFGEDANGEIYVCCLKGAVKRIGP